MKPVSSLLFFFFRKNQLQILLFLFMIYHSLWLYLFSSEEGNGSPLQYSCRENPMDRGAWWATAPWGYKESDMIEQLSMSLYLS